MSERKESRHPTTTKDKAGNTSETGISVWYSEEKELSFDGTPVQFKNTGGKWRISLRLLADYYGIPFHRASAKISGNKELFRDLNEDRVTRSANGSVLDYDLSIRDAVAFLNSLDYKRYEDARKQKLIGLRNWLSDTAEKILTGDMRLVPTINNFDKIEGEYEDHSFLNRLAVEITRKERAKNPHGGIMSEKEMYKEDFGDICGPVPFVKRWRNKLDKQNGRKLTAKKVFVIHEMLSKNTERKSMRAAVINTFETVCPDLMPDYMPRSIQLDTTKQMKLLGEA